VLLWGGNYWTNYGFYVIFCLLVYYFFFLVILTIYDYRYFRQESLLEFLKKEILRVHRPYSQKIDHKELTILGNFDPEGNLRNRGLEFEDAKKRRNRIELVYNPEREDVEVNNFQNKNDILNLNKNDMSMNENKDENNLDNMFNFVDNDKKDNAGIGLYLDTIDAKIDERKLRNDDSMNLDSKEKNNFFGNGQNEERRNKAMNNFIGILDLNTVKTGNINNIIIS
jgi:hypothetical protein